MREDPKSLGLPRKRRRFGRAQDDPIIDTYKLRKKLPDPTRCPSCGAVYHDGRWRWPEVTLPSMAHEALCTACHRISDKYPAGIVTIRGPVVRSHKGEVLGLVRNTELAEKSEHCQNRLMAIEEPSDDVIIVTTTDIHLPRRIGEALHRAFHGDLQLHYDEDAYFVRVEWQRDS
jgi:hypothetical protein